MKEFLTHIGGDRSIRVEDGLLNRVGGELAAFGKNCRVAILSDRRTFSLHGPALVNSLTAAGYRPMPFLFRATERRKDPASLRAVLSFFSKKDVEGSDIVLCLGGEVVADVGLLAASLYRGGLRTVLFPTTLGAQIRVATVGCAVNFGARKDCLSLLRAPELVLVDPSLLSTLSKKQLACGMAELIRHAMIADRALFDSLTEESGAPDLGALVPCCIEEKLKIFEDLTDGRGDRRLLQFGHTLADSLETTSRGRIPHGYAVAIGMAEVTRAAARAGICEGLLSKKLDLLLRKNGLPTASPYPIKRLLTRLIKDKKAKEGDVTLILPLRPGVCEVRAIPVAEAYRFFTAAEPSF